jgi:hypothetical protein
MGTIKDITVLGGALQITATHCPPLPRIALHSTAQQGEV